MNATWLFYFVVSVICICSNAFDCFAAAWRSAVPVMPISLDSFLETCVIFGISNTHVLKLNNSVKDARKCIVFNKKICSVKFALRLKAAPKDLEGPSWS